MLIAQQIKTGLWNLPCWALLAVGTDSQKSPAQRMETFEHHLTVIYLKFLRAKYCEKLITNASSDIYTPVQNPGTLPVHGNWCPLKFCCANHPCPGPETTTSHWELPWGVIKSVAHRLAIFNSPNLHTEINPKRLRENLIITPGFLCWVTVLKSLLWKKWWPQENKQDFLSLSSRVLHIHSFHWLA